MVGADKSIYEEIAKRTGGDIYIGVVGPVRTGKSTMVKRIMESLVIPNITNIYQKERAKDELPQSGSGKTIMTSEPKFVPEEAITISPDGKTNLSVRMIDSVGYMIPGALGADEDGKPRMVTTPWLPMEIPMTEAAELGTKKVMEEHCSIGMVVTTDGTITEIPRRDYVEAEERAIQDMKATGKPFLIVINSTSPDSNPAQSLKQELQQKYNVTCHCMNCLELSEKEMQMLLTDLLYEFPVTEVHFWFPSWIEALKADHPIKSELYRMIRKSVGDIEKISNSESVLRQLCELESVENIEVLGVSGSSGIVNCEITVPDSFFYGILSDQSGFTIKNDSELMDLLCDLASIKKDYDKIATALDQVRATGYGIVMPTPDEMHLDKPEIVRKGSNYGVKLKASAPSIHMMRADIRTEINPIVGDEKQSEDLLQYLLKEYEGDTEKLWGSNIFGKSVFELVNDGLSAKLRRMPEQSRFKLQSTLTRIINEGSSGLLCIILG